MLFRSIKICDFGVSRIIRPKELINEHCGTPAYIAPEIAINKGYKGFAADIWSSGIVLYAMLYGTVPFKASNINDLKALIIQGKYKLKPGISEEAKNLLKRLIEHDPDKRITIPKIFRHKWMKKNKNVNIFAKEEIETIAKEYMYINDESLFTEQHVDSTENDLEKNVTSKSNILAPFNTSKNEDSIEKFSVKEIINEKKDLIKFSDKVRDIDRQYEKNNNAEIDNGVYNKLISASSESENLIESDQSRNISMSIEDFEEDKFVNENEDDEEALNPIEENIVDNDILQRMEDFGYSKEYMLECIRNKVLNYATTTYYLLLEK